MARKSVKFFLALLTIFFACPTLGNAQPQKPLLIVIDESFPPYTIQYSDDSFGGLHVNILQNALSLSDIPFKIIARPWKRLMTMTDSSQVDASIPWRAKKERFEKYHMVGPIAKDGTETIFWSSHRTPDLTWEKLEDLAGYKIGVIDGYAYPKSFETADFLDKYFVTADNDVLIKWLYHNRVDLVIGDKNVLLAEAARLGISGQFYQVGKPIENVSRYIAVPKDKPDVAKTLQAAIDKFHATHDYPNLINKYE